MKILSIVVLLGMFSANAFACGANDNQADLGKFLDSVGDGFFYQKDNLCPKVEQESKSLYKRLTEGEVLAIHAYTENGFYKGINRTLRARKPKAADKEKYGPIIKLMKSGMKKLPNYKGDVLRFVSWSKSRISKLKAGQVKTFKAFTSTSRKPGFTWSGNTKLHIKSKTGKYIGFISQYASEEEVLFLPKSKFRITKVEKADCSGCKTNVYLDEVAK